jgi:hypothetical protein
MDGNVGAVSQAITEVSGSTNVQILKLTKAGHHTVVRQQGDHVPEESM